MDRKIYMGLFLGIAIVGVIIYISMVPATAKVVISGVTDLYGYEIDIACSACRAVQGNFLGKNILWRPIQTDEGVKVIASRLGNVKGVSGSGVAIILICDKGKNLIKIKNAILVNSNGKKINGDVKVVY